MTSDGAAEGFVASYILTEDWLAYLRSARLQADAGIWRFQVAAAFALYIMSMLLVGFLGALAAAALRAETELILLTVFLSVFGAAWAVRFWANRVSRPYQEAAENAYTIGAKMRFAFDASGFRMTGDGQDWRFDWRHLTGVEASEKALWLRTPFARFVVQISALPIPAEEARARVRYWHRKATGA